MRSLLPPRVFRWALLAMGVLHFAWPVVALVSSPWRWVGLVPIVVGMGVAALAKRTFKRVGTNVLPYAPPTVLVTIGAFALSRNPMYAGMVAALVGFWMVLGTLSPGLVVLGYAAFLDLGWIRREERAMHAQFGRPYDDYRRRTRRWL